jgi:hypothetical protein
MLVTIVGLVPVALATQQAAHAAVTTPAAGTLIRDAGPVPITEAVGGRYVGNTTGQMNTAAALCTGSNANQSPPASTRIRVIRVSDNAVVFDKSQITPNSLSATAANAKAPFSTEWNTTGAQAGFYRILSTGVNTSRAGLFSPCVGTPVTFSDHTIEYRPWQAVFTDALGTGTVSLNTTPKEGQWKVKGNTSPVVTFPNATGNMHLFTAPNTASLKLSVDPEACVEDPSSCLPETAVECTGPCEARFALIGYADGLGRNSLTGVFDLRTKAFVALARANAVTRVLLSLGPDLDQAVKDFFGKLIVGLSNGTGVDLPSILSTKVRVRLFNDPANMRSTEVEISLIELVTIARGAPNGPNGVNVLAPFSLGVGSILHSYQYAMTLADCGPTVHEGYRVTESQLVPSLPPLIVPAPPPLLVVEPGGTLKHVDGDYPTGTGAHLAGPTALGPEIDTAPDSPTGLPAWLPVLNPAGTIADSDIDFVGHAIVVVVPEIRINPIPVLLPNGACIGFGTTIGTGVALFGDKPLSLGILPVLWDEQNPKVVELIAQINSLAGNSLSNPAVQAALGAALALLAGAGTGGGGTA